MLATKQRWIRLATWKQTTVHLGILNAGHKAEMDQAGYNFLQAVQANYEGIPLHHQVKEYLPDKIISYLVSF